MQETSSTLRAIGQREKAGITKTWKLRGEAQGPSADLQGRTLTAVSRSGVAKRSRRLEPTAPVGQNATG